MEQDTKTLADYLDLVKRRKYYILFSWGLISVIAVIVAFNLPKTYRSTATLLIEAPIPTKIIESTAGQFGEEQIQSIYQRVMTTENVLKIIEANGLYNNDLKNGFIQKKLVDLFRSSVEVKLVTSSLAPRVSGMAETAFEISFSHSEAIMAKEIASHLANLFIEQSDKSRTQRAIKATDFLMEESDKLNLELQVIENKIAAYKEQHNFILPEQVQANLAAIDRTENELRDTTSQIRTTKERIAFLAAGLARTQYELPSRVDENTPQSREDTITILRAKYLRYSSIYSPSHPSLVRLERQIKALDPSFEGQPVKEDVYQQLAETRKELKLLEEMYAGNHPDITKRKKQINKLEEQLKNTQNRSQNDQVETVQITNPASLALNAQYKSSQSELQALIEKQDFLQAKLEKMQALLSLAPQIEREYTDLVRERDSTVKKYTQLKEKWLDAKLVQTLEEQQQGQSLTLIDQPIIPEQPEKAIRRKVAIGGFFMGLIAGVGLAFLIEFLDPGVRGYRAISKVTGLRPLVVVPYIESPAELEERLVKERQMRKILVWSGVVGITMAILGLCIYLFTFVQT